MKNINLPLIPGGATSLGDAFSIFVDGKSKVRKMPLKVQGMATCGYFISV